MRDSALCQLIESRLRSGTAPEDTAIAVLEVGARVLAREATTTDVDFVQREFEKVGIEVERAFTERAAAVSEALKDRFDSVFDGEAGLLQKALDAHVSELAEIVASHFGTDRKTAVQNQVEEKVRATVRESHGDLVKHLSSDNGSNPLADFKRAIHQTVGDASQRQDKSLTALRDRLSDLQREIVRLGELQRAGAAVAEVESRGTAKGRTYEEEVFSMVEAIATGRGDVALHVGDERSAVGGKRGDIVVEIDAASGAAKGRFVIEVKDERLSKNKAWEVLNESMAQRDAAFGLLVVAESERVPAGREPLHEYEGNKMIVTVERSGATIPLDCAYRYVRMRCLMAREKSLVVDAAGVRAAAEEAGSALRDAQRIRSALTGAGNSVEQAREALESMVERVSVQLDRVETLIEASSS